MKGKVVSMLKRAYDIAKVLCISVLTVLTVVGVTALADALPTTPPVATVLEDTGSIMTALLGFFGNILTMILVNPALLIAFSFTILSVVIGLAFKMFQRA